MKLKILGLVGNRYLDDICRKELFCIEGGREMNTFIMNCSPVRTGPNMKECNRLIESIEYFYGYMEITCLGSMGLCSIEYKEEVGSRKPEILEFCSKI